MKLVYGDYIRIAGGFFWWWKWVNFRQLGGILPPSLEFPTKVLGKGEGGGDSPRLAGAR